MSKTKYTPRNAPKRRTTKAEQLTAENADLRAIHSGKVDALPVDTVQGTQTFTLKDTEYSYRVLIEAMSEGAATLDTNETILYCNPRFAEMLHAPLENIVGSKINHWIAPRDRKLFQSLLTNRQTPSYGEFTLRCANRKLLPAYLSVSPLQMNSLGMFCVTATDLTEQKRNQSIVASEKLARTILDQTAEAIVVCDTDARIIRANQVAQALCPVYPVGQLFAAAFPLRMSNDKIVSLVDMLSSEIQPGVEAKLEWNERVANLIVNVRALRGEDEQHLGYVVTLTDITDRKQLENRLLETVHLAQQQANELQSVITSMPIGLVIYDQDGNYVLMNDPAREFFTQFYGGQLGLSLSERVAKAKVYTGGGELIGLEDMPAYRALKKGETITDYEIFVWRGARKIYLSLMCAPIRDANGDISGAVSTMTDITERKHTEEKLRQHNLEVAAARGEAENERNRLEALMHALPVGVAITDVKGGNVKANQAFEKIWGNPRPPTRSVDDYQYYKAFWCDTGELVQPEDWASSRVVKTGEAVIGQLMEIERFGNAPPLTIINSAAPIRDATGQIVGSAVAIQDITPLHQAEQLLKQSEEQFFKAFHSSPVAMSINRLADGLVLDANASFLNVFGYNRSEVIGHASVELGVYNSLDTRADVMRLLRETEHVRDYELSTQTRAGQALYLLLAAERIEIGGEACILTTLVDITERKQMERSLVEAHQRLQSHLENLAFATVEFDPEFRVIRWSAGAERIFGWSADEVLNQSMFDLRWIYQDDANQVTALSQELFSGHAPRKFSANRNYRKDGTVIDCEWYNSALFDSNGKLISIYSQVLDVTERRHLQVEVEALARFPNENPSPVLRVDRAGIVLYANPASVPLLKGWNCAVGTRLPEYWYTLTLYALETGEVHEQEAPAGEQIFNLILTPIVSGGYVNIYGRDITARKRAEQKLAEQAFMLANISDAVLRTDVNNRITYWSKSAERLYGYTEAQVLGKTTREVLQPIYLNQSRDEATQLLQDTGHLEAETIQSAQDGRRLVIEIHAVQLHDEQGQLMGLLAINRDITERKHAEEALQQQADELRSLNEELTGFNRAMVGRELYMIELKKQVNELCSLVGQPRRYALDFEREKQ